MKFLAHSHRIVIDELRANVGVATGLCMDGLIPPIVLDGGASRNGGQRTLSLREGSHGPECSFPGRFSLLQTSFPVKLICSQPNGDRYTRRYASIDWLCSLSAWIARSR